MELYLEIIQLVLKLAISAFTLLSSNQAAKSMELKNHTISVSVKVGKVEPLDISVLKMARSFTCAGMLLIPHLQASCLVQLEQAVHAVQAMNVLKVD